ncbi:DUF1810 domain-containing protein [Flavobacterium sp. 7A]|uniref:DUF1810 domain-containing protein n=1 Tax=Flavobacterium sp. 7A TaxID=2940571 RepID=UPI0022263481|nr:DUF1810 domain-containing protein [Flavobacterium sp. 7A]MCW2121035.1 uncharacterized protein (DUF1810 family) [Flavobacterium sp. 7A]
MITQQLLNRFLEVQETKYQVALNEIQHGKKQTHWMWYIFPQIKGLGSTENAVFYGINNLDEAQEFFNHPILGPRLIQITQELLKIENKSAFEIMGTPDDKKLKSCMTLFGHIPNTNALFQEVLNKYFKGEKDLKTIILLKSQ